MNSHCEEIREKKGGKEGGEDCRRHWEARFQEWREKKRGASEPVHPTGRTLGGS